MERFGKPITAVVFVIFFILPFFPIDLAQASVPAIVAQDEGGTDNSPVSFNTGKGSEMSQGHMVNVNVATGNLTVRHTDLVVPTKGGDIVIDRTYNSNGLLQLNGVEEGFELSSSPSPGWVACRSGYNPCNIDINVSPGVVWINGERVVVADPVSLQLTWYSRPHSLYKTIYVKNMGSGIGSVFSGSPGNATDIYAIGSISAVDYNEEYFLDLSLAGQSLNTGIEYGDVKLASVYHERQDMSDWTLKPGTVRIRNKVYRVNELYLGQTYGQTYDKYVVLSPGANGAAEVSTINTYPTAAQFPEGYVIINILPSRPLAPYVKFKKHMLGTGGQWRFSFEEYATHAVQSGASGYDHYLEFYTGDGSKKEVIVPYYYPDLTHISGQVSHTTKLEYLTGSLQYPAAAYSFDTGNYNTDSGTVTCDPIEFELESLKGHKKIFRGVTTGFGRTDAVLTEKVDASGNRLVYEWVDGPNGYFKGIDGTDVPRDYRINRIYDDRDYNGPDSVQVLFSYNAAGRVTSIAVTDASGNNREVVAAYTYTNDQLVGFTDFHGRSFVYDYNNDFDNLLLGLTDQDGGVLRVSYWDPGYKVYQVQSAEYSNGAIGGFYPTVHVFPQGIGPLNEQYYYDWENRKTTQVIAQVNSNTDSAVNVYTWDADVRANTNILEDRRILRKDVYKNQGSWGSYPPVTWKEWTYNPDTVMVTSVIDGNNRTTFYQYNSKRQMTQRSYPDGTSEIFAYGAYDNLISKTDRNNNTVSYSYNDPVNPHLVTEISYQVDGVAKSRTLSYYSDGLLNTDTNSGGHSVSYTYDLQGQFETKNYARTVWLNGSPQNQPVSESFNYNIFGQPLSTVDPAGHQVTYTYDSDHYLTGKSEAVEVDGQQVQRTESYGYDALGNLTAVTDYEGGVTLYSYNADSLVATVWKKDSSGLNHVVGEFDYDTGGRLTWKKDGVGHETETHRNAAGWVTSVVERDVTTETGLQDLVTTYTHDNVGNVLTKTLPGSAQPWTYTYDGVNRLKTVREPGSTTDAIYDYDGNGNLISFTDPNANGASFIYNEINKVSAVTQAGRATANFLYDGEGRVIESWEGPGPGHNLFSYNGEGTLGSAHLVDGQVVKYGYDVRGLQNYSSRADTTGSAVEILSSYNINGLLSSRTQVINGTDERTMGFNYNAMGQVRYVDYPHQVTGDPLLVEYQYSNDAFHRLEHVPGYVDNVTYDGNGRVMQIDFANGLSENTHRDELGRPIDAEVDMDPSATVDKFVQRYDYAWNARGNLAGRTWEEFNTKKGGVIDTVTETFAYDPNDRLTSMSDDSGLNMPYVYDPAGNRLNDPAAGLSQVDTFDSCNRFIRRDLTGGDYLQFSWTDPAGRVRGNLVSRTYQDSAGQEDPDWGDKALYSWTEDNLLKSVSRPNLSTPVSISYLYDAGGDRVRKVSSVSGMTTYMFLGLDVQYEEHADGTVDYYVYALGRQVARIKGNPGHHGYGYEWYYYHSDYLNSVWAISDSGGKVVWAQRYRPFGSEAAQSGSLENEYRFAGKGYDAEAGLYYFNARWYDPDIGRFISEDPVWGNIRDPQSLNRFRYARNNPLKLTDPTGMYDDQDNDGDTEAFGGPADDGQDDGYDGDDEEIASQPNLVNWRSPFRLDVPSNFLTPPKKKELTDPEKLFATHMVAAGLGLINTGAVEAVLGLEIMVEYGPPGFIAGGVVTVEGFLKMSVGAFTFYEYGRYIKSR